MARISSKPLILIVDDDCEIRKILVHYLTVGGYEVLCAESGEAMRKSVAERKPDLVILDLGLPDTSGLALARELREDPTIGIIILSGSIEKADKIVGLEIGADDYVQKPFDERELLARIRSVLRRLMEPVSVGKKAKTSVLTIGHWQLDLLTQSLHDEDGNSISLTHSEFELLSLLARKVNTVLTRDEISELVSSRDWLPTDRSIDVLISKLRKKIEADPAYPSLIKTVRGVGYILTSQVNYLQD